MRYVIKNRYDSSYIINPNPRNEVIENNEECYPYLWQKEGVPTIELLFLRHGEYYEYNGHLARDSRQEIFNRGINIDPNNTVGFFKPNTRSFETLDILLDGDARSKLKADPSLGYRDISSRDDYKKAVDNACEQKSNLKFMLCESDKTAGKYDKKKLTTATSCLNTLFEKITKYCKIEKKWSKLAQNRENKKMYRLFCANEFIYPAALGVIIQEALGEEVMHEFVQRYTEEFEKVERRDFVLKIKITKTEHGNNLSFVHSLGQFELTEFQLRQIYLKKNFGDLEFISFGEVESREL